MGDVRKVRCSFLNFWSQFLGDIHNGNGSSRATLSLPLFLKDKTPYLTS
ncbi:hypothetical protein JGUZn3_19000 [Entomobacter blattae]|uniref:Uncharacterized protein n=1 Tax=Entomobacter blattae TaxID=2762277 RepID=A0A7H1NTK4_9PROT|nr:hypothetical protein JGUZn3_19000 [Entomobacter blattae]